MYHIITKDTETRIKLGEQIEKLRRMQGVSREELSELTGLGTSTLYRMEKGESPIDMGRICQIAAALHISREDILSVL